MNIKCWLDEILTQPTTLLKVYKLKKINVKQKVVTADE